MSDSYFGKGMSPRKVMAGGMDGGSFGVSQYPGANGKAHPDRGMATGSTMEQAQRAVGHPVERGKGMHAMQAHPDHGIGSGMRDHFQRGGRKA